MTERIPTEQAERLLAAHRLLGGTSTQADVLADLLDARRERDEARAELERERARPPRRG
jgi:hypothetical protein